MVTVIDDRPKFADHARAAGRTRCSVSLSQTDFRRSGAIQFLVHHRDERAPVRHGMSGSHPAETVCLCGNDGQPPQVTIVKDQLEAKGVCREALDGVHTPNWDEDRRGDAGGDRGVCDGGDHPGEECRIRKRRQSRKGAERAAILRNCWMRFWIRMTAEKKFWRRSFPGRDPRPVAWARRC